MQRQKTDIDFFVFLSYIEKNDKKKSKQRRNKQETEPNRRTPIIFRRSSIESL